MLMDLGLTEEEESPLTITFYTMSDHSSDVDVLNVDLFSGEKETLQDVVTHLHASTRRLEQSSKISRT